MPVRSHIRGVATILLFTLCFAQAAVAATACDMPDRAPAQAFTQPVSMPCHEEPAPNANLCLAHCLSADQSADTPQLAIPAWHDAAPLTVAFVEHLDSQAVTVWRTLAPPATPPPQFLVQVIRQ